MNRNQEKAMFVKGKPNRSEWQQILENNKIIAEERRKYHKYFDKINHAGGFAFSDMEHLKRAKSILDKKLEQLAKKHNYVQDGYSKYQPWLDHSK